MSVGGIMAGLHTDEDCWESVEREFIKLRALTAERKRLARMFNETLEREAEALTAAQLALTVLKNRLEKRRDG